MGAEPDRIANGEPGESSGDDGRVHEDVCLKEKAGVFLYFNEGIKPQASLTFSTITAQKIFISNEHVDVKNNLDTVESDTEVVTVLMQNLLVKITNVVSASLMNIYYLDKDCL